MRRSRPRSFGLCRYGSHPSLAVAPSAFHIGRTNSIGISTSLARRRRRTRPSGASPRPSGASGRRRASRRARPAYGRTSRAIGALGRGRARPGSRAPAFDTARGSGSPARAPSSRRATARAIGGASRPSRSQRSSRWKTASSMPSICSMPSDSPKPGNIGTMTSYDSASSLERRVRRLAAGGVQVHERRPAAARGSTWILPSGASTYSSVSDGTIRRPSLTAGTPARPRGTPRAGAGSTCSANSCHVLRVRSCGRLPSWNRPSRLPVPSRPRLSISCRRTVSGEPTIA